MYLLKSEQGSEPNLEYFPVVEATPCSSAMAAINMMLLLIEKKKVPLNARSPDS